MTPSPSPVSQETPFLLLLFPRTSAFHRPEEFSSPSNLPTHIPIYTHKSCTLLHLSHLIAVASPNILPSPSIGTRLVFRIIFADARNNTGPPRYTIKDIGSVVIGLGGPGAETDESDERSKTLGEAKFVVGDYISVAILPPSEITGEIQQASAARTGRGNLGALPPGRYGGGADAGRRYGGRETGRPRGGFPRGEWRRGEQVPDTMGGRGLR